MGQSFQYNYCNITKCYVIATMFAMITCKIITSRFVSRHQHHFIHLTLPRPLVPPSLSASASPLLRQTGNKRNAYLERVGMIRT